MWHIGYFMLFGNSFSLILFYTYAVWPTFILLTQYYASSTEQITKNLEHWIILPIDKLLIINIGMY